MAFKKRRPQHADGEPAAAPFEHASGYSDLAGLLGEHTLDSAQETAAVWPKGYRARSIAKSEKPARP
jgi:hypothetical protein